MEIQYWLLMDMDGRRTYLDDNLQSTLSLFLQENCSLPNSKLKTQDSKLETRDKD